MDTLAHGRFVPPVPTPPPAPLPLREFLRAIRDNALTIWPEQAYHDDVTGPAVPRPQERAAERA